MLRTRLTDMLGCDVPIMLAGMGGIAGKELTAAVSRAGGFGVFGSATDVANKGPEELRDLLLEIKALCNGRPFGVDILVHGSGEGGVLNQIIDAFVEGGAKLFVSGKGFPRKDVIGKFHSRGMLVASIAGKVSHAVRAVEAGVDFVICQGMEAGGHTGEVALSVLLPQVIDAVGHKVPVVAAGGIFDGRGLAAALSFGASGVWVGTRFMMSPEANTHQLYKEKLLRASSDDTMVTKAYSGARMRVLKNPYVEKYAQHPELLEENSAAVAARAWKDGVWKLHSQLPGWEEYDDSVQAYVCSQAIGAMDTLVPAGDIVREMAAEAAATLSTNAIRYVLRRGRRRPVVHTPLCDMLGCEVPIMLAGMGGIAGKELVAAVTNAGGFGVFGSALDVANPGPEELLEEIKSISRMCNGKPFGVDILVHGASGGVMKVLVDAFADGGATAFISGKGFPRPQVIEAFHARNMKVGSIAGKLSHAVRAVEAGVDFVICQATEGGGHTGNISLSVLLPQVVDAVGHRVPVVAAGGIYDSRGVAASLAWGAQGVWVGTRFMLTPEAKTHVKYKERLLKASSEDTMVTRAYTGAPLRVLRNPYVERYAKSPELLEKNSAEVAARAWKDGVWKLHSGMQDGDEQYDDSVQAYVVGQCIGAIHALVPAADIVKEMSEGALGILEKLGGGAGAPGSVPVRAHL